MIINIGIYFHTINGIVIYFGKNTIRLCLRGGLGWWFGSLGNYNSNKYFTIFYPSLLANVHIYVSLP